MRVFLPSLVAAAALAATTVPVLADTRLVTLGGTVTEIVYALGEGDKVVATDASSLYPAEAQQLPSVGYYRGVPVEGVLSARPDLVLASENAGPPEALSRLAGLGVELHTVSDRPSLDSLYERIRVIAKSLGRKTEGEALVAEVSSSLEAVRSTRHCPARRAVVLLNRSGSFTVAGRNTTADAVLKLAGLENAMHAQSGYKPLSIEGLVALAPEVIVLTTASADAVGGVAAFATQPAVAAGSAAANGRVGAIDDLLILGMGPRVAQAVSQLCRLAAGREPGS